MRNLWILTVAQAFGSSGMIILVTYGGIVGTRIAPSPSLATLPLALTVVGIALSTIPAALSMRRWGRRRAFVLSALVGAVAALLAAWAIAQVQFLLFCLAGVYRHVRGAGIVVYDRCSDTACAATSRCGGADGHTVA